MEESLELLNFLEVVKKRKVLIFMGALVCFLSSIVATAYTAPTYEATAQLLVSQGQAANYGQSSGESYQAALLSERLTKTFSQIIKSRTLAEKVMERLELSISPEDLGNKVSADPVKDTQIIRITVADTNPTRAKNLANTYTDEFIKMVSKVIPPSALISVNVVDRAVVPLKPVKPKPVLNAAIGILVGLMASVGFAVLLELLDISVKESDEVEELTGLRSLGRIPRVKKPLLINNNDPQISEAFRSIRTNLQYINFDRSIRTLQIASPIMGEGKTTITLNLGAVIAHAGLNVLIIDCDLIRPSVGKLFRQANDAGLADILVGAASANSVITATGIDGLSVMASGPIPPNSADLLNSERMDELLSNLKKSFDLIILDSPPVLTVADTAILASKVDAVLLASSFGSTKKSELVAAEDVLNKVGARIIGFVINKMRMHKSRSYYYYKPYVKRQVVVDKKAA